MHKLVGKKKSIIGGILDPTEDDATSPDKFVAAKTDTLAVPIVRAVVLGNSKTGKTTFISKLTEHGTIYPRNILADEPDKLYNGMAACKVDFLNITTCEIPGISERLQIWDFGGMNKSDSDDSTHKKARRNTGGEYYRRIDITDNLHSVFLRPPIDREHSDMYIIVFDLSECSFEGNNLKIGNLDFWLSSLLTRIGNHPVVFVGTHSDILDAHMKKLKWKADQKRAARDKIFRKITAQFQARRDPHTGAQLNIVGYTDFNPYRKQEAARVIPILAAVVKKISGTWHSIYSLPLSFDYLPTYDTAANNPGNDIPAYKKDLQQRFLKLAYFIVARAKTRPIMLLSEFTTLCNKFKINQMDEVDRSLFFLLKWNFVFYYPDGNALSSAQFSRSILSISRQHNCAALGLTITKTSKELGRAPGRSDDEEDVSMVHAEHLNNILFLSPEWLAWVLGVMFHTLHATTTTTTKKAKSSSRIPGILPLPQGQRDLWPEFPRYASSALLTLTAKFNFMIALRYLQNLDGTLVCLNSERGAAVFSELLAVEKPATVAKCWPSTHEQIQLTRVFHFQHYPLHLFNEIVAEVLRLVVYQNSVAPASVCEVVALWAGGVLVSCFDQKTQHRAKMLVLVNMYAYRVHVHLRVTDFAAVLPETIPCVLLSRLTTLMSDRQFRGSLRRISVVCQHCINAREFDPFEFSLNSLRRCAAAGTGYVYCRAIHPVRLAMLIPDIAMIGVRRVNLDDLQIQNKIGEGGFGQVFRGVLRSDGFGARDVAVKKIHEPGGGFADAGGDDDDDGGDDSLLKRFEEFRREAEVMSGLVHPNLVQLIGISLSGKEMAMYMIMEFIGRGDLFTWLARQAESAVTLAASRIATKPSSTSASTSASTSSPTDGTDGTGEPPKREQSAPKRPRPGSWVFAKRSRASSTMTKKMRSPQSQFFTFRRSTQMPRFDGGDSGRGRSISNVGKNNNRNSALARAPYPWTLLLRIASDIAIGMNFLHSATPPIIHNDLKSLNILLVSEIFSDPIVAKVADFGLSMQNISRTKGRDVANPRWLAPEVMMAKAYTEKADCYSFGIILWELFHCRMPFESYNITFNSKLETKIMRDHLRPKISPRCPPAYVALMCRCWAKNAGDRPSFKQILSELREIRAVLAPDLSLDLMMPPAPRQETFDGNGLADAGYGFAGDSGTMAISRTVFTGKIVKLEPELPGSVRSMVYVPAENEVWLGYGGNDAAIAVWDVPTKTLKMTLRSKANGSVNLLALIDGAVWSSQGAVLTLWAVCKKKRKKSVKTGADVGALIEVGNAAWCGTVGNTLGCQVQVRSFGGKLKKRITLPPYVGSVLCMLFYADTNEVWVGGGARIIRMDAQTYAIKAENELKHTGPVHDMINVDGFVWTCSSDKTICVWDKHGKCLQQILGHKSKVFSLLHVKDCVWSGSWDKSILIWDIDTKKFMQQLDECHDDAISGMLLIENRQNSNVWEIWSGSYDRHLTTFKHKPKKVKISVPAGERDGQEEEET